MFHVKTIKNWFRGRVADYNKIAEYLNNLCGSRHISLSRPDNPSSGTPPVISLDLEKLTEDLDMAVLNPLADGENAAQNVPSLDVYLPVADEAGEEAEAPDLSGTSGYAARADHTHRLPFTLNGMTGSDPIQPPDVYVPEEDEDTSNLDLSGSLDVAARADHTHQLPFTGANSGPFYLYINMYKPEGTSHYYGTKVEAEIKNGLWTTWNVIGEYDIYTGVQVG